MRRSLTATLLLALSSVTPSLEAQVLDQTMVPRGRLRLQASPVFESWDTRFGRDPSGMRAEETLSSDLTDPTTVSLFPGIASMTGAVRDVTAGPFDPVLGSTASLVHQDVTRVEFGGHVGVFDWLTVGLVVPWARTRTAIDVAFTPDSANANIGLNPVLTAAPDVETFLGSTTSAEMAATAYASSECAGGPSPTCTTAEELASRAAAFDAALQTAYGASPFFPLAGSPTGDALVQAATTLDADLVAAGLGGLAPMILSSDPLLEEGDLAQVPAIAGGGSELAVLGTRQSLWSFGDLELSARLRLLDNLTPPRTPSPTPSGEEWSPPGVGYRVTGHFMARLPTGTRPNPDIPLDLGTGEAQTDLEGGLTGTIRFGSHVSLTAGGYYGTQGSTTITTRVAPPETVLAPRSTLAEVTWRPGFYVGAGVVPGIHLAPSITIHGEYRYFHKGRDEFELVDATSPLDPAVLAIESGVKAHLLGGGLRYDTVDPWRRGDASTPMEVHLRLLTTFSGSGGQVPKATRLEAGLRLFRRFWGPETP